MPYKNKERRLKYWSDYNKNNHEKKWRHEFKYRLKVKFNMTIEDYNKLLETQDFRCALCRKHISELPRRLSVDHCHETGKIRGLLCLRCNSALGELGDTYASIENVLKYLNQSGSV